MYDVLLLQRSLVLLWDSTRTQLKAAKPAGGVGVAGSAAVSGQHKTQQSHWLNMQGCTQAATPESSQTEQLQTPKRPTSQLFNKIPTSAEARGVHTPAVCCLGFCCQQERQLTQAAHRATWQHRWHCNSTTSTTNQSKCTAAQQHALHWTCLLLQQYNGCRHRT
jgi:hypothetical protein